MKMLVTALLFSVVVMGQAAAESPDAANSKDALRRIYSQFSAEADSTKKQELAQQMKSEAEALVKAEPDGLGGWLLLARATVALKDLEGSFAAATALKRLKVEAAANPLAKLVLSELTQVGVWNAGGPAKPVAQPVSETVALKDRCQKLPNGDEALGPLPKVIEETPFDELDPFSMAWLQKYFGWDVKLITLLSEEGYDSGKDDFNFYNFITGPYAKAAKMKVKHSPKLDANDIRREIRAGRPVLLWRNMTDSRENTLARFAAAYQKDPTATLPDPKDKDERALWPVYTEKRQRKPVSEENEVYSANSIVYGFNEERGEFIFLDAGFEEGRQALRIRSEELEFITTDVFIFD